MTTGCRICRRARKTHPAAFGQVTAINAGCVCVCLAIADCLAIRRSKKLCRCHMHAVAT